MSHVSRVGLRKRGKFVCIEGLECRTHFSVDLSAAVGVVAPKSGHVKPGQHVTLAVAVSNVGTDAAIGPLTMALGLSATADGSSPISFGPITRRIHVLAGKTATIKVSEKIPIGFTPAAYFGTAVVDVNNAFSDSDIANNSAVSLNPVTVDNPFPNLLGTWTGSATIRKGVGKGAVITQALTFTSESDTTGDFTFTGTNSFPFGSPLSFAGQGTITTHGVIIATGADVPFDDTGVLTEKARLVGLKIKGTFSNSVSSGTGTFTFTG